MRTGDGGWMRMVSAVVSLAVAGQAAAASTKSFAEIWGYLYRGEEAMVVGDEPFTDIGYFSAEVGETGRLAGPSSPPELSWSGGRRPRYHLVISTPSNRALMHFCLRPDLPMRAALLADIVRFSRNFDGVQVDFEALRKEDGPAYWDFLRELRAMLPAGKILSVAVMARWTDWGDAFNYPVIAAIADRVVVMAYDEHWSTGEPGPVASLPWCIKVLAYAQQHIPAERLLMGVPLYGRAWQDRRYSRALRYPSTLELIESEGATVERDLTRGPHFRHHASVTVHVYFDDTESLLQKLGMYEIKGLSGVAFWRVGQGPAELWRRLAVRR